MTDDELTAASADMFRYFDFREAADERTVRLKQWAWSIICWDGALPLVVICIPKIVQLAFPRQQNAILATALVVPIVAFFMRGAHAFHQYRCGSRYVWQTGLFAIAILALALAETVFILFESMPNIAQAPDWCMLGLLYLGYLVFIAIALFPVNSKR